jgi:hypothetical protein
VLAWRLHHLTRLGQVTPDVPCTVALADAEWRVLALLATEQPGPGHAAVAGHGARLAREARRLRRMASGWRARADRPVARLPAHRRSRPALQPAGGPGNMCIRLSPPGKGLGG